MPLLVEQYTGFLWKVIEYYLSNPEDIEEEKVTAASPDGKVLEGICIGYSPVSSQEFFEWNFGPAEPGDYMLHVPFVCQKAKVPVFS